MEELFQYMKTLRSQINDVADEAAKLSVEEHMQCTTMQALQKDLDSAREETKLLKEEIQRMSKLKGDICVQMLEKQKKIASLQADSCTLSQTCELMQQERLSLSRKLVDQSEEYKRLEQEISEQLRKQQEFMDAENFALGSGEIVVKEKIGIEKACHDDADEMEIHSEQPMFDRMEKFKEESSLEINQLRQPIELMKTKMSGFKQEVRDMNEKRLEEEYQALLSDKAGEAEALHVIRNQFMRLKDFSYTISCSCCEVYTIRC